MVPDLLELSLGECSAGAFFQKLAELFGGTLVVVESPCGGLGLHVQVTVDSVGHFVESCSVEMFCGCSDEVEVEVKEAERGFEEDGREEEEEAKADASASSLSFLLLNRSSFAETNGV